MNKINSEEIISSLEFLREVLYNATITLSIEDINIVNEKLVLLNTVIHDLKEESIVLVEGASLAPTGFSTSRSKEEHERDRNKRD